MTRVVLGIAAVALVLASCGDGNGTPAAGDATALATRTIEAGAVTVKITPRAIDDSGATFDVALDTHSVELDMDLADRASLEVDGESWSGATWNGDGPSGHHREGTLAFDAGGTAERSATLTMEGFPEPVQASWDLGER